MAEGTGARSRTRALTTCWAVGAINIGLAAAVESMSHSGWAFMKADAPFAPRGPQIVGSAVR